MHKMLAAGLVVFLLVAVPSVGFAATHYVPDDYGTIQAALDGAVAGDEIIVRDGTWMGAGNRDLSFGGKALTLQSENGAASCIIDCESSGRGFYFHSGETTASVVDGFSIMNGYSPLGGGIYCDSSSPTISNCTVTANTADILGGGIHCSSSSPIITNCSITGNTSSYDGGGLNCTSSSPTISNCSITANTAEHGGGICCNISSPIISNCTVTANTANYGGGMLCTNPSSPTIANCFIATNTAGNYGGGIYCSTNSLLAITNCSITANTAGNGGGLYCTFSSPAITNCILWGDLPNEIYLSSASLIVTYSDIEGGYGGAGNINADPLLYGNGYHLAAGSPCIDTGTDAGVYEDIEGDVRPTGAGYDMGCDELVPAPAISCHPASFNTSCFQGFNPWPQGLTVWNSGILTLSYSISDNADWLSCTPASGTSTGEADSITVSYNTAGLVPGKYQATISISDPSALNDPQYVPVELTVMSYQLTAITLVAPANESILTLPPTFSWEADGGTNNVFAVDLSLSYPITGYWSTFENMGLFVRRQRWTPFAPVWSTIPSGSFVYWRVRGANLDNSPLSLITSNDVWWFYKK